MYQNIEYQNSESLPRDFSSLLRPLSSFSESLLGLLGLSDPLPRRFGRRASRFRMFRAFVESFLGVVKGVEQVPLNSKPWFLRLFGGITRFVFRAVRLCIFALGALSFVGAYDLFRVRAVRASWLTPYSRDPEEKDQSGICRFRTPCKDKPGTLGYTLTGRIRLRMSSTKRSL